MTWLTSVERHHNHPRSKLRQYRLDIPYRAITPHISDGSSIAATETVGPGEFMNWMTNDLVQYFLGVFAKLRSLMRCGSGRTLDCWMVTSPRKYLRCR